MAGNPIRKRILTAAGLWPPPEGMSKQQALPLALAKLGCQPGTRLTDVQLPEATSETTEAAR